jgi:hypothetical protein
MRPNTFGRLRRLETCRPGIEYSDNPDSPPFELYLAIEDTEHTRTKAKYSQTNGICERFLKTILNEFYRVTLRKRLYYSIERLPDDRDDWPVRYNVERIHQGRWCFGKTPKATFVDSIPLAREKLLTKLNACYAEGEQSQQLQTTNVRSS